jgi:hypothetical protein
MPSLLAYIVNEEGLSEKEAKEDIRFMIRRVQKGAKPEEVLSDIGISVKFAEELQREANK